MKLKVIKKSDYKVSKWSGGTTTEFYIYPEGSSYSDRKFDIRLSSATMDDEESVFTKLPGIYRSLMLLDGDIVLKVNGKINWLKKFDHIEFNGSDDTLCEGKAVDFNLMSRFYGGYTKVCKLPIEINIDDGLHAFYCFDCNVQAINACESIKVEKEDTLLVSGEGKILLKGDTYALYIFSPLS